MTLISWNVKLPRTSLAQAVSQYSTTSAFRPLFRVDTLCAGTTTVGFVRHITPCTSARPLDQKACFIICRRLDRGRRVVSMHVCAAQFAAHCPEEELCAESHGTMMAQYCAIISSTACCVTSFVLLLSD